MARTAPTTASITRLSAGVFQVVGSSGVYMVRRSPRHCSCPGFSYRATCRHLSEVKAWAAANPAAPAPAPVDPHVEWLEALGVAA
jgi:predicted nucleic acid-binding Zn finger protein